MTRISGDRDRKVAYADLIDIGGHSNPPPEFSLVALAATHERLLALQPGDLVVAHGRISVSLAGAYRVVLLDIQRLEIEGEQQAEAEAVA